MRTIALLLVGSIASRAIAVDAQASWREMNDDIERLVSACHSAGPISGQDEAAVGRAKLAIKAFKDARTRAKEADRLVITFAGQDGDLVEYAERLDTAESNWITALHNEAAARPAAAEHIVKELNSLGRLKSELAIGHARCWRLVNALTAPPIAWTAMPMTSGLGDDPPALDASDTKSLDDRGFATAILGCVAAHRALAHDAIAMRASGIDSTEQVRKLLDEIHQVRATMDLAVRDRTAVQRQHENAESGSFAAASTLSALERLNDPFAYDRSVAVFENAIGEWRTGMRIHALESGTAVPASSNEVSELPGVLFVYRAAACSPTHGVLAERLISYHDSEGMDAAALRDELAFYEQLLASAIAADAPQRALAPMLLKHLKDDRHPVQAALLQGAIDAWKNPDAWQKANASFQTVFESWLSGLPQRTTSDP